MAEGNETKVYTVFASLPADIRERILKVLNRECRQIEFVGKVDLRYSGKDWVDYGIQMNPEFYVDDSMSNSVLQEIEDKKDDLAGIILFFGGQVDKRFLLTGLPTIIVDVNPFPSLQIGFKWALAEAKMNKVNFLVSSYSEFDLSDSVAKERINDLAGKVELFRVISKMKNTKILDVQVKGFGAEPHEHWWRLNQEVFLKRLKESLGMDVKIMDYRDFFKEYEKIPEKEAMAVARKWIDEQIPNKAIKNKRNIGGITERNVMDGAKVYLTADRFVKEFKANAITVDSMTWSSPKLSKGRPCPSMSPGIAEFQLHGIPAVCE